MIVIVVFLFRLYMFSGPRSYKLNPRAESLLKVQYIWIFYHVSTLQLHGQFKPFVVQSTMPVDNLATQGARVSTAMVGIFLGPLY